MCTGVEIAGVVAAVVGAGAAAYGASEQRQASKRQSKAQKEAKAISTAQQKQEEMEQRREAVRQQRIRAAQVEQSAANAGVSGSSGELGAISGTQTVTGANIAFGKSTALAAQGLSAQNQNMAEANLQGQTAGAITGLGVSAFSLGMSMGAGNALFGEGSQTSLSKDLDNKMNSNPSIF